MLKRLLPALSSPLQISSVLLSLSWTTLHVVGFFVQPAEGVGSRERRLGSAR